MEKFPAQMQELLEQGRAWDTAMRVGTGGGLVDTPEQLQVEKQNDGRHDAVQKRKNGHWREGWVFLQVRVQFACVVLHIVLFIGSGVLWQAEQE